MNLNWIVAVVAPRDVAVHPNFHEESYSAPRALASRLRGWDFAVRDTSQGLHDDTRGGERELLKASRDAFRSGPAGFDARNALLQLAGTAEDLALATVSSLFYAVSAADQDDYAAVHSALAEMDKRIEAADSGPAVDLMRGLILVQQALRASESAGDVVGYAEAAQTLIENLDWEALGALELSPGISWDAKHVWSRVREELLAVATAHISTADPFSQDQAWATVIRRESPPIRSEFIRMGSEGLEMYVAEHFNAITRDPTITIGGGDTVEGPLVDELMHYELTGSGSARHARMVLGQMRLARSGKHGSLDSLRLLRGSGEVKVFARAAQYLRATGPLAALRDEVMAVVERRHVSWWRDVDLEAIAHGADLLTREEAAKGYVAAHDYLSANLTSGGGRFVMGTLMTALASLANVAGLSSHLAECVYGLAVEGPQDQALMNSYGRALSAIDWQEVDDATSRRWRDWLASGPKGVDHSALRLALSAAVGLPTVPLPAEPSLEDIAAELNNLVSSPEVSLGLERAKVFTSVLLQAMSTIREEADRGVVRIGGINAAALSVMVAREQPSTELWQAIADFLTDRRVSRELKTEVIERVVASSQDVPASVVSSLRENYAALLESPSKGFWRSEGESSFSQAIRLAAALGLLSEERLLSEISRLASETAPRTRVEAAKSLTSLAQNRERIPPWGYALLIQLSRDPDATVRAHGGHGLALARVDKSSLANLWEERVIELLREDAVLGPLLTLRGLSRRWRRDLSREEGVVRAVSDLRNESLSFLVRDACVDALTATLESEREY